MSFKSKSAVTLSEKILFSIVVILGLFFVTWIEKIRNPEMNFFAFYFIPICTAAWYGGPSVGAITAVAATGAWFAVSQQVYETLSSSALTIYWNAGMRLIAFLAIGMLTGRLAAELRKQGTADSVFEHCDESSAHSDVLSAKKRF